jgi:hypothetical protein
MSVALQWFVVGALVAVAAGYALLVLLPRAVRRTLAGRLRAAHQTRLADALEPRGGGCDQCPGGRTAGPGATPRVR